jgi:tetratricopeptide (TPR) repeat protein
VLFDLRSRGRRRMIQVVYGFLAVLIGGGLVLFGVGSGSGGTGVLSQLAQNGGGSASGLKTYVTAVTRTERAAKAAPNSAAAWDRYSLALYRLATVGNNYVASGTETGYTPSGAKELAVLDKAWNHYLSLSPAKPDITLANEVAAAFGTSGIQEFSIAESAQEIVTESQPKNFEEWATLAADAYLARDTNNAKIAQAKALKLAPKADRTELLAALAAIQAKASPTGTLSTGTSGATGTSGTSG